MTPRRKPEISHTNDLIRVWTEWSWLEVTCRHFRWTEKNCKKPQWGQWNSRRRFQPETSKIWSRTATFDHNRYDKNTISQIPLHVQFATSTGQLFLWAPQTFSWLTNYLPIMGLKDSAHMFKKVCLLAGSLTTANNVRQVKARQGGTCIMHL